MLLLVLNAFNQKGKREQEIEQQQITQAFNQCACVRGHQKCTNYWNVWTPPRMGIFVHLGAFFCAVFVVGGGGRGGVKGDGSKRQTKLWVL